MLRNLLMDACKLWRLAQSETCRVGQQPETEETGSVASGLVMPSFAKDVLQLELLCIVGGSVN